MIDPTKLPGARDKLLFTPGPLTTSRTVKQAMLRDLGSRDFEFIERVRAVRERLLALGEVAGRGYEAIPMQGSGTFGIEAVIASTTPPAGRWLVLVNGAYGRRIELIARTLRIPCDTLRWAEDRPVQAQDVATALAANRAITHVALVHCETSSGILNPVEAIGAVVKEAGRVFMVDAMSSFGGVSLDVGAAGIDYLVSSANKCIEGVPGFSFVLARRDALLATEGHARSVSLDLLAQWRGLEANGQFRFTPPTHALLAFHRALEELAAEGGVAGRAARYRENHRILVEGMRGLGFEPYLAPEFQSAVITGFRHPPHPAFDFERFYALLNERGIVIYPGKVSDAHCFRIGTIGRLFPADVRALLAAVCDVLAGMGALPLREPD